MPFRDEVYAAKERQRTHLATLPIEEKVKRLVRLQERAAEVAKAAGRKGPKVWKLLSGSSTA